MGLSTTFLKSYSAVCVKFDSENTLVLVQTVRLEITLKFFLLHDYRP